MFNKPQKEIYVACPKCSGQKVVAKSMGMFSMEVVTFECSACDGLGYLKFEK